jgi:hypothetical protein
MRTAIIILALCGLILLAFASVWYPALTGADQAIVAAPVDSSQLDTRAIGSPR